jgi:hypothetical protein
MVGSSKEGTGLTLMAAHMGKRISPRTRTLGQGRVGLGLGGGAMVGNRA